MCSLGACQQSVDTAKKTRAEKTVNNKKEGEPSLSEFKRTEPNLSENSKTDVKPKQQKSSSETKVKAEQIIKPEQVKISSKPISQPKKKPDVKKPDVKKPIEKRPSILFEEPVYDFGEITEGDIIKHKFKFKNTGNSELIIKSAYASCGCTDPSYPFIGTPPGEEGYIGVTYNSVSKDGPQKPEVSIKTNIDNSSFVLYLTGSVKPKKKQDDGEKSDSTELKKND